MKLQFDLSQVSGHHSPLVGMLESARNHAIFEPMKGGAVSMFKHYRLQLDITDKTVSAKKNPSFIMIIGPERLQELCWSIAQYLKPIRVGGPFVRDLFYDLRFLSPNHALPTRWSEEMLLRLFTKSTLSDVKASASAKSVMDGCSGWWDFPHVTIHNALNKELANEARNIMTSAKWESARDFVQFITVRYEEAIDRWNKLEVQEAVMLITELSVLMRIVNISKQARTFRKGRHARNVQLTLSFYSFACSMTTCGIALTIARRQGSREMAKSALSIIPQTREAIEDYVDLHEDNRRQFHGFAVLQEADAYRLLGDQAKVCLLERTASRILGDELDLYKEYIKEEEMPFAPPTCLQNLVDGPA